MKPFNNVSVVLFPEDEKNKLDLSIENANLVSKCFESKLTILKVSTGESAVQKLENLKVDLILLNYDSSKKNRFLTLEKRRFLELCSIPILMIPNSFRFNWPPFESVLVPMRGEKRESDTLVKAINIGNALEIPIDILHVVDTRIAREPLPAIDQLSNHIIHEYPAEVEEFIAERSPFCGPSEKGCIREFCHLSGVASKVIRRKMQNQRKILLLFEWQGHLEVGRAKILKTVLKGAHFPTLLMRAHPEARGVLEVGEKFRAA